MGLRKWLYGLTFCVGVPALLIAWAVGMDRWVRLPVPPFPGLGAAAALAGLALILVAMGTLWRHGRGLPMNAFPPEKLVTRGPYAWVRHPIYVGFCAMAAGLALLFGSASGWYIVAPLAALACVALVVGYERPAMEKRFGPMFLPHRQAGQPAYEAKTPLTFRPRLRIAQVPHGAPRDAGSQRADLWERLSVYPLTLAPWAGSGVILFVAGCPRGITADYVVRHLGQFFFGSPGYAAGYALALAAPLLIRSRNGVRAFMFDGWAGTAVFVGVAAAMLALRRSAEGAPMAGSAAFWAGVTLACLLTDRGAPPFDKLMAGLGLVALACMGYAWMIGGAPAVAMAVALLVAAWGRCALWRTLRTWAEYLANAWTCREFGPVRVINHAGFAGLAGGVGGLIVGYLAGPAYGWAAFVAALCLLAGSALWGQLFTGSSRLLRPFGYYGAVFGGILGAFLAPLFGREIWPLLAACAVAAPWVQAIGRMRCLVQGCCHGRPAPEGVGIRYRNSRSRVVLLSSYRETPIHPTQLYSILSNVVIGFILWVAWCAGTPTGFVCGLYLILANEHRFVEEAYRGEPQTRRFGGLTEYQWIAIGCALAGVGATVWPTSPVPAPEWRIGTIWLAMGMGLAAAFVMGVDFPRSQRRFARLSG